jgi:hypothetical protein
MTSRGLYGTTVVFKKRGSEIKQAIRKRCAELRGRLEGRNRTLAGFMDDRTKLRSYLVLSAETRYGMHEGSGELRAKDDISSEEIQDITESSPRKATLLRACRVE